MLNRTVKPKAQKRNITGAAIRRIRMAAQPKITQEDMVGRLARLGIEVHQSTIAKIENGERPVLDFELRAISDALKVRIETLFQ